MKTFSQEFEEYKNSLVGKGSLAEESFLFWTKNFLNQPQPLNPNDLLSGKIYSFEYLDILEKPKKFINKRPVVFFAGFGTGEKKDVFSGIDLILIPPMIKIPLFNRIMSVYESSIRRNIEMQERGEIRDQIPLKTDFEILNNVFSGIPFKNSYRSWDIKKVRDLREIPYQDWTKIVYLFTRSIQGTPIEEIYKKNMT
jgi:hypothetical protein